MNLRVPGHYDLFKRHENSKVFVAEEKKKKEFFIWLIHMNFKDNK